MINTKNSFRIVGQLARLAPASDRWDLLSGWAQSRILGLIAPSRNAGQMICLDQRPVPLGYRAVAWVYNEDSAKAPLAGALFIFAGSDGQVRPQLLGKFQ